MADKIRHYRDLRVWQEAVELATRIYQVTEAFPAREQYGLTNQMRRASVSIASNIAEGFGRSSKEFARFLEMALGSLAELETQTEIARRVGFLGETDQAQLTAAMNSLGRQLNVLHQKVRQSAVSSQRSAVSSQQSATSHQQSATSRQRPATSDQPPATNDQRPTTSHQRPATSHQRPTTNDQ